MDNRIILYYKRVIFSDVMEQYKKMVGQGLLDMIISIIETLAMQHGNCYRTLIAVIRFEFENGSIVICLYIYLDVITLVQYFLDSMLDGKCVINSIELQIQTWIFD